MMIPSVGEGVEELECSYTAGASTMVKSLPLRRESPYEPVIPSLGKYLKTLETRYSKPSTGMFPAVLLTIANPWKPLKHSSTGDWINKV